MPTGDRDPLSGALLTEAANPPKAARGMREWMERVPERDEPVADNGVIREGAWNGLDASFQGRRRVPGGTVTSR